MKCVYIWEYYLALKKKELLPYTIIWMNLEDIILKEISQTQGEYCIIPLI